MGPARLSEEFRASVNDHRRWVEHCHHEGCGRPTQQQKPYCTEHFMVPDSYAQRISDQEATAKSEVVAVVAEGIRAVNVNGLVVDQILMGIAESGNVTYRRLIKDKVRYIARQAPKIHEVFLERLVAEGLVTTHPLPRKQKMAALTDKGWETTGAQSALVG